MVRIILVMHAPLGSAFSQCARHVLGQAPDLTVVDVEPDEKPDQKAAELADLIAARLEEPVLILCDIFGATPFNIASQALRIATERGARGHLVTGTNLCMVLKALTEHQENPDKLTEKVRLGALKGIIDADHKCLPAS
jgi:PTS system ascorbate-specific IIA component